MLFSFLTSQEKNGEASAVCSAELQRRAMILFSRCSIAMLEGRNVSMSQLATCASDNVGRVHTTHTCSMISSFLFDFQESRGGSKTTQCTCGTSVCLF